MQGSEAFERLDDALVGIDAEVSAAQSHGMLCGMLSAPGDIKPAQWIAHVLADTQPTGDAAKQALAALSELYQSTAAQMEDAEFGFNLLLPDDTAPLAERATALGSWCDGFLYGLGLGALKPEAKLPREVSEALRDMGEIARVEIDPDAGEENEAAYSELVEYVRVAALLVMESLREPSGKTPPTPDKGKTVH